jgi:hypothetical protein
MSVIGPVVQLHRRHRVREVTGITSCYTGEATARGAYIDASIAHVIDRLNRLGYLTNYSCSGLPEDHGGVDESMFAYISFQKRIDPSLAERVMVVGFSPAFGNVMYAAKHRVGKIVPGPDGWPVNENGQRLTPQVLRTMWRRLRRLLTTLPQTPR